jgi:hypothetical protein
MDAPWSSNVLKMVTSGLPRARLVGTNFTFPWGIQLTSGQRCLAAQGAHDSYDGFVVEFNCGPGPTKGSQVALLRGLDRAGPVWSYRIAQLLAAKSGTTFSLGPIVHVRVAYYGGP